MEDHPVPTDITRYQFRLIGDMTLRQFGLLSIGVISAIFLYASPLPGFFKWPLAIGSLILGAAMAFVPLEERPLDRWIMAFFRSAYSPTQYLWKKSEELPELLKPGVRPKLAEEKVPRADRAKLEAYLATLPQRPSQEPLDQQERRKLGMVESLFATVEELKGVEVTPTPELAPAPTVPEKRFEEVEVTHELPVIAGTISLAEAPLAWQTTEATVRLSPRVGQIRIRKLGAPPAPAQAQRTPAEGEPERAKPEAPPPPKIKLRPAAEGPAPEPAKPAAKEEPRPEPEPKKAHPVPKPKRERGEAVEAKIEPHLPFPSVPEQPNILVGMVLDREGRIIERAILEIRDASGHPVRALKTNKLGQFRTATPLPNGAYEIETEKEGLRFDIIKIELKGEIVQPIEIRAK